jgi:hypothetical protein
VLSCGFSENGASLRDRPSGNASYAELAPLGPLDKTRPQGAVNLMQRTLRGITLQEAGLMMCSTITWDSRC